MCSFSTIQEFERPLLLFSGAGSFHKNIIAQWVTALLAGCKSIPG
jgi:hypothetical protein